MKNTFNEYIDFLLEYDATSLVEAIHAGDTIGRQIVMLMLKNLEDEGHDEAARFMQDKILSSSDPKIIRALNEPIRDIYQLGDFGEMLGLISKANDVAIANTGGGPNPPTSPTKSSNVPGQKRGIFGTNLGKIRGTQYDSDIERAFKDIAVDFNQGTLLKKLQMLGSAIGGVINPTADVSQGVFKNT